MSSKSPRRRFTEIIEAIDRIRIYVDEAGSIGAAIKRDSVHRDAIERRLQIISEAAVKLGSVAPELAEDVPWQEIRGLGNFLRHDYDEIDETILESILLNDLQPLRDGCEDALEKLGPA